MDRLSCLLFIVIIGTDICQGATASTKSPNHDVGILAQPTSIHNGYTKYLTVNCTFNHGPTSDFSTIMSLILSKSSAPNRDDFSEVASLTAFSSDSVDIGNSMGAEVKGHLEAKGQSFISLEWTYPSGQVEGKYKCEAFGMDNHGHPRTSTDITIVMEKNVDLDLALSKMKEMDRILDDLLAFEHSMNSRVQDSRDAIMEASTKFGGHTYYLSRPVARNNAVFNSMCQLYGGYLVEPNNVQEFNILANFVRGQATGEMIALGARDDNKDGIWTLQSSGDRMTFIEWLSGKPSGSSDKQCLYMTSNSTNHGMLDDTCVETSFNRFICEMSN